MRSERQSNFGREKKGEKIRAELGFLLQSNGIRVETIKTKVSNKRGIYFGKKQTVSTIRCMLRIGDKKEELRL